MDSSYLDCKKTKLWDNLIFPRQNIDEGIQESCIEYIDCEEADNCLIAVKAQTLQETYVTKNVRENGF